MKSLFEKEAYNEIVSRINSLQPNAEGQWGKMKVAQMMAHCSEAYKVPLSDTGQPRMFMGRIFGPLVKGSMHSDKSWKQNLPTAPNFIIKGERDFATEKTHLLSFTERFHKEGPTKAARFPHPFFGKFTTEQWGKLTYKHLDHHLKQFGA